MNRPYKVNMKNKNKDWQWAVLWSLPLIILSLGLFFANHFYFTGKLPTASASLVSNSNVPGPDVSYLEVKENTPKKTTLMAVGDIMLARHVGTKMAEAKDYTLPFIPTAGILSAADITIGNLESPFYNQGPRQTAGMVFKAEPEAIAGLQLAGFDVLTLANNHMLNQGEAGLKYTLDYLKGKQIATIGAGSDFIVAHEGIIKEVNDLKFGFLGYSYSSYHDQLEQKNVVAGMNVEQLKKDVINLKTRADIIVVVLHAGEEYTNQPNQAQVNFAHAAIEAGADLVIGHHPHWPQIVETYQGKWIFYSLGNFVFDQEWSRETKEGLILSAAWSNSKLSELKLIPVVIENYSTPRLATTQESKEILDKIGLKSDVVFQADNR